MADEHQVKRHCRVCRKYTWNEVEDITIPVSDSIQRHTIIDRCIECSTSNLVLLEETPIYSEHELISDLRKEIADLEKDLVNTVKFMEELRTDIYTHGWGVGIGKKDKEFIAKLTILLQSRENMLRKILGEKYEKR